MWVASRIPSSTRRRTRDRSHSRTALVSEVKALDRVIRSGRYWVPDWSRLRTGSHTGTCSAGRRNRDMHGLIPDTWWSALG